MNKGWMLVPISVVVTLAVCELGLRIAGLYPPSPFPPEPYWTEYFGPHPEFGYSLHPGIVADIEYPPADPRATILRGNRDGFRQSRELDAETEHATRALLIGDSHTFGIGVEESERFTDRLEQLATGLRVDNAGMPGWGLDMMMLAASAVVPKTRPDYVCLVIDFDDFRRVRTRYTGLGHSIPRFRLTTDGFEQVALPTPRWFERTHLYEAVARNMYGQNRIRNAPSEDEWLLNERLLDRILELTTEHDAELVLAYLPNRQRDARNVYRSNWLRDYAESRSLAIVDLTTTIHDTPEDPYLVENSHYNVLGHDRVGHRLAAWFDSLTSS